MNLWKVLASSGEATAEEAETTTPVESPLDVRFYRYAPDGTLMQVDELGWSHRLDGPVFDGEHSREWWVHGQLHRLDGPALETDDGAWEWRRRGRPHRTDGPAIRRADGTLEWWLDGLPHRAGGPSCIEADGTRRWHTHGRLDRIEYADGRIYPGD